MRSMLSMLCFCMILTPAPVVASAGNPVMDRFSAGDDSLEIHFLGHGTLMFRHAGKVVHVDPVTRYADYTALPPADLVLITHSHGDHLEAAGLKAVRKAGTVVVHAMDCVGKLESGKMLGNDQQGTFAGLTVQAVPAYNLLHEREPGRPFHPRGDGNGYVITFGTRRVYVAGDTENIPEMKALQGIDIAFLPMNLPYTMTPEMTADAARMFKPAILYPYHYGDTDPQQLVKLLADVPEIEVRIRDLR